MDDGVRKAIYYLSDEIADLRREVRDLTYFLLKALSAMQGGSVGAVLQEFEIKKLGRGEKKNA